MSGILLSIAITSSFFLILLWLMAKSFTRLIKQADLTAYQSGVMEGLVWPHGDEGLASVVGRDEVDQSTARYFVNTLNEAYDRDPRSVMDLFNTKIPANLSMMTHPTIPVAGAADDIITLSPLGIVNGLLPIIRNRYRVALSETDFYQPFKVYDMTKGEFLEDTHAPT